METLQRLLPADLKAVVTAYREALGSHQEALNRLNVYPVPDGDTGTNMVLTLDSVVAELDAAVAEPVDGAPMPGVCRAIARGSLMGARGNSGIILSQVLGGIADVCAAAETVDAPRLAAALTAGCRAAYAAVVRPVEGTILTVARAAAEAAASAAGAGAGLVGVLDEAKHAADDALARTPELLPVLEEAGVVDAGGAGLVLLLDALLAVTAGRPLPEPHRLVAAPTATRAAPTPAAASPAARAGAGSARYEVMCLLEAPEDAVVRLKQAWAGIGESIAVVGGGGTWNCHVHTHDAGAAIEAAVDCGRPSNIKVTDLAEQVEEERWVREAAAGADGRPLAV
jgi:DAK2 domain fusion protein YloV